MFNTEVEKNVYTISMYLPQIVDQKMCIDPPQIVDPSRKGVPIGLVEYWGVVLVCRFGSVPQGVVVDSPR